MEVRAIRLKTPVPETLLSPDAKSMSSATTEMFWPDEKVLIAPESKENKDSASCNITVTRPSWVVSPPDCQRSLITRKLSRSITVISEGCACTPRDSKLIEATSVLKVPTKRSALMLSMPSAALKCALLTSTVPAAYRDRPVAPQLTSVLVTNLVRAAVSLISMTSNPSLKVMTNSPESIP